jgi:hypothetical protein
MLFPYQCVADQRRNISRTRMKLAAKDALSTSVRKRFGLLESACGREMRASQVTEKEKISTRAYSITTAATLLA